MRPLSRPSVPALVAAGLVAFTAAAASAAPDLQEILAKHAQALGGLEKLGALKTGTIEGSLSAGGLTGQVRGYFDYPAHERSEVSISIVHTVQVLNGEGGWQEDQTGQLKDLEGSELAQALTERYLDSYRYLTGDPSEGKVELSTDPADSSQYVNLAVRAAGGDRVVVALDPETWLPRKRVLTLAVGKVEVYLSDYRVTEGVPMAYRSVQVLSGDVAHSFTSTVDRFQILGSLPDSLWRRPGEAARNWALPAGTHQLTLPIEVVHRHITLKASVNGKPPLTFILDSGAGATTVNRAVADRLGLKSEGKLGAQGVGGSTDFGFTTLDTVELGGLRILGMRAATIDLSGLASVMDVPVDGVLGYDFLSLFPVSIDYAHSTLTLTDPETFTPPAGAAAVPFELEHNVPVVDAAYNGAVSGKYMVDTGNNGWLLIHTPTVNKFHLVETARKKLEMEAMGAGGKEVQYTVRGDSLALGGFSVRRPLVALSTAKSGVSASETIAGNIGGGVLENFVVTFDYPHEKMYLERGANFGKAAEADRIGWQLGRRNGKLEVLRVLDDTPAASAGVLQGDQLLNVDGQDVTGYSLEQARALGLRPAGTKLRFGLLREGKPVSIEIQLSDMLD